MKQSVSLPLARLAASLAIFGILLCIHLNFTLAHFLPPGSKGVMDAVYVFFFIGAVLGTAVCPLFLPLPGGKNKPPPGKSLAFIAFLIAVEFITRSLGAGVWFNSAAVRGIMAVPEGMLTTACYGLFYLAWLERPPPANGQAIGQANRTGKFCSLVLSAALLSSVLARYYSVPLLEAASAAAASAAGPASHELPKNVELVFNFIKWCMLIMAVFAAAGVVIAHNAGGASAKHATKSVKTDWPMILRLIGLASVFTLLNGLLDMRMYPLYSEKAIYYPHYLTVAAAVPVLGFLAGRSISGFIRWFLPPAIVLFILVSCLPLFEHNQRFNVIMSTLVAVAHYTIWVVFSTAVVEYYASRSQSGRSPGGRHSGFLFYGMAAAIFFTAIFAFLAPVISPLVPDSTEYYVLLIVIAAVLFMLMAFRLIFPKQRQQQELEQPQEPQMPRQKPAPASSAFDDIFRERGLSRREIEVARLLVKEGFGTKEIGRRLFITAGTAKLHISKIYQKFGVNNRAEFMALFVK